MNILWIGNHEEGVEAFAETVRTNGVCGFITLDDSAYAKRSAGTRAYYQICQEHGIPYHMVETIKGEQAYELVAR